MITDLAGLEALRDRANGGGATAGKEYLLMADIVLSGTWTAIDTAAVSGNVEADQQAAGLMYLGGAAGRGGGSFRNIVYSGTIAMNTGPYSSMNMGICTVTAGEQAVHIWEGRVS
jgi:hypothetical protein